MKSEVVMLQDDFTLLLNRNRYVTQRHSFKKKKKSGTGLGEDDFTLEVILLDSDLTQFKKKIKINGPHFTISGQRDPEIQKSQKYTQ